MAYRALFGRLPSAVTFAIGAAMPFLDIVPLSAKTGGAAVTPLVLVLLLAERPLLALGLFTAVAVAQLVKLPGGGLASRFGG